MQEAFAKFDVARFYIDPRHWETQADRWADMFGADRVILWPTNKIERMFQALSRFIEDSHEGITTHDADPTARIHALNARRIAKPGDKYVIGKPSESQKIDILMADILAHEAAADMRVSGWAESRESTYFRLPR